MTSWLCGKNCFIARMHIVGIIYSLSVRVLKKPAWDQIAILIQFAYHLPVWQRCNVMRATCCSILTTCSDRLSKCLCIYGFMALYKCFIIIIERANVSPLQTSKAETTELIIAKFWMRNYMVTMKKIVKLGQNRFYWSASPKESKEMN